MYFVCFKADNPFDATLRGVLTAEAETLALREQSIRIEMKLAVVLERSR